LRQKFLLFKLFFLGLRLLPKLTLSSFLEHSLFLGLLLQLLLLLGCAGGLQLTLTR